MARFLVLSQHGDKQGENIIFVRDGFRPLAFVLPVFWLLWNRLWLQAALMFALTGLVAAGLIRIAPAAAPGITALVNLALGSITALEGPAWLAADLARKGSETEGSIMAGSLREAEEIYASQGNVDAPARIPMRGFRPVSQSSLIPLTGV